MSSGRVFKAIVRPSVRSFVSLSIVSVSGVHRMWERTAMLHGNLRGIKIPHRPINTRNLVSWLSVKSLKLLPPDHNSWQCVIFQLMQSMAHFQTAITFLVTLISTITLREGHCRAIMSVDILYFAEIVGWILPCWKTHAHKFCSCVQMEIICVSWCLMLLLDIALP